MDLAGTGVSRFSYPRELGCVRPARWRLPGDALHVLRPVCPGKGWVSRTRLI